jgi:hypothetical protein
MVRLPSCLRFASVWGTAVRPVFLYRRFGCGLRRYGDSAAGPVFPYVRDWPGLRRFENGVVCLVFPYRCFRVGYVVMGIVRQARYSHTYAIGVVCVDLRIVRIARYSLTDVLGAVCGGMGIVRQARYPHYVRFRVGLRRFGDSVFCLVFPCVRFRRRWCALAGFGRAKRGPVAVWTMGPLVRKACVSPYLLRTFLNRSEEALARANWPKPGSTDARLALMIWSKVLFFMVFFLSPRSRHVFLPTSVFPCRRPRVVCLCFSFLVLLLCLHRTSGGGVAACRARLFFCISVGLS